MRLMNLVCLAGAIAALSSCLPWNVTTLETQYTDCLAVKEIQVTPNVKLEIYGILKHSSLVVSYISKKRLKNAIIVEVHLAPVGLGKSGVFNYTLDVPNQIDNVYFGKEKAVIWVRSTTNVKTTK